MELAKKSRPLAQLDEIIIRQITESDLPNLEWNGVFTHYRRLYKEAYLRTLQNGLVMWVAVTDEDQMLGQLFIQLTSSQSDMADGYFRAYMFGFRVKPEFQCQGIGTLLLLQAEKDLAGRLFQKVCLNVTKTNERARQMYERHGYKVLFSDPGEWMYQDNEGMWHEQNEPAWRMEKTLRK